MSSRPRKLLGLAVCWATIPALVLAGAGGASADPAPPAAPQPVPIPDSITSAVGDGTDGSLAPSLRAATGTVTVSVTMSEQPVAASVPEGATTQNSLPSAENQQVRTSIVVAQQDQVVEQAAGLGASELGRASKAANVVAMTIPAENLTRLASIPGVLSVKPVARYEILREPGGSGSLAQAAEHIKANAVRAAGYDGTGIKVAILDSGIDFTHEYLSGPGTAAAYDECYKGDSGTAYDSAPTEKCALLFGPAAPKVKGGYDFVGETWPNSAETPDPNPIDYDGHGTHVSDIAGGRSADGTHQGIAPGVDLYAVKVCSAVAPSCSGVALLQAMDWVLDPNDDGDLSDAVDIVNLSLGRVYGQEQDDLSAALNNLVRAGVVAVASAGNNADRPFIVGSPSTAERVISVAQTALPDDKLYSIAVNSPTIAGLPSNTIRNARLQSWSPAPAAVLTGRLWQPGGTRDGCMADSLVGFPAGAIALVKRGACAASTKAQNAQAAGASAVVIWNNVPGDPPDFSFGGGVPVTVPTLTISFAVGTLLSNAVAAGPVQVTIDPAATIPLTNTMAGSSSRGLAISGLRAKPDIGAPGAWLSAEVGTGNGQTSFGGTSGAAPVVTGAAALVLDRYPSATPAVVKARLLNGANTQNRTVDADGNLYPTPISRIGAGEVRVAPAVTASAVLLNTQIAGGGNVGLGLPHLTRTMTYPVRLQIRNTGTTATTYRLAPEFRDPADAAGQAVTVRMPNSVRVPGRGSASLIVRVTIDPAKLANWPFTHAAGYTGDGSALNGPEFDGYIRATSPTETLHLGWTVLPHRSADVSADNTVRVAGNKGTLTLTNRSRVLDGAVNVFGLTGTSPRKPEPGPGEPGSAGSDQALVDLFAVGVRDDVPTGIVEFAIAGQQRQTVPLYPAGYEVDIDTNRDGNFDFAVYQDEAVGFGSTGLSLVYVENLSTGTRAASYYTDADFDVSTSVLPAPLNALGLTAGSTFDFTVLAYDNYFSGAVTDVIEDQSWTVGSQKYSLNDGLVVPAGGRLPVTVTPHPTAGPSSQTGFLLFYDDAVSKDAQAVRIAGR